MDLFDINQALEQARQEMLAGEKAAQRCAKILVGRCRHITRDDSYWSHELVVKLKRELSKYDAKKRQWKD